MFCYIPASVTFTSLGFIFFVFVDEQVTWTFWAAGQQDALHHRRDEDEAHEERPQFAVAHDGLQSKHLQSASRLI